MDRTTITEEDEGKSVVNHNGDKIGMISGFRGGKAYVDPDPGLTDSLMSKLGWNDVSEDAYPIDDSDVGTVTENEVRLRSDL